MRGVRRATRRKYAPEEKIRIVLEGFRREGINPANYYSWTKEFMEAGKERLARNTVRDATRQEIEQLKRENGDLKEILGRGREVKDRTINRRKLSNHVLREQLKPA